jgi:D-glycero-D-manno-heptose 1,7-bisphosphate phosphatase
MKLIILDQTGVINQKGDTLIKTPDEWKPIPGSLQAIARLTHAGYRVVTAINQSAIGRSLIDMTIFNTINNRMIHAVQQEGGRLDALFFCPNTQHDK